MTHLALLGGVACGLLPERVSADDPRVKPMFEAISKVDRFSGVRELTLQDVEPWLTKWGLSVIDQRAAELLIEVKRLAAAEREATADLIRSLCEVEARQLHLAVGCSSMFGYCTQVLHLSEVGPEGRCPATAGLEYHHRIPFPKVD